MFSESQHLVQNAGAFKVVVCARPLSELCVPKIFLCANKQVHERE